jgi:hypothetical protein
LPTNPSPLDFAPPFQCGFPDKALQFADLEALSPRLLDFAPFSGTDRKPLATRRQGIDLIRGLHRLSAAASCVYIRERIRVRFPIESLLL